MAQPSAKHRILAEEVVRRRVRDLDRRVLHAVDDAERRHQLAGGMHRDLELAARHLADLLGEHLGGAEDGVERARKARRDAPADAGLRADDRRRCARGEHARQAGLANERTTLHEISIGERVRNAPNSRKRAARRFPGIYPPERALSRAHAPAIFIRSISTEPMVLLADRVGVGADGDHAAEHLAQVAGDRHLVRPEGDPAVLDPEAGRAARVVAGHVVDALPHQLDHEQAAAELGEHRVEIVAGPRQARRQRQVVRATGMAGGVHAELARRVGREEVAADDAGIDDLRRPSSRRPRRRTARCPCRAGTCGSSTMSMCAGRTRWPRLSSRNVDLR